MTTRKGSIRAMCLILWVLFGSRGMSYGRTIRIPLDYETIQAGIDAAVSGDTVKVDAGAYIEGITMKEGVKLIGSGAEYTSIYNYIFPSSTSAIVVMDSNCVIDGFTISSDKKGRGIVMLGKNNLLIKNMKIKNCQDGIAVYNETSSNLAIINNVIFGCDNNGVGVGSYNLTIRNNEVFDCGTGLSFSGYGEQIVSNNLVYNCDTGLGCSLRENTISKAINNTIVGCNTGTEMRWGAPYSSFLISSNIISECKEPFGYTHPGYISSLYNYIYGLDPSLPTHPDQGTLWNVSSSSPLFVDPNHGDFHLQPNSPCRDAGAPEISFNDPDGSRNDMGAYGGPGAADWGLISSGMPVVTKLIVSPNPVAKDGKLTIKATGKIQE